DQMQLQIITNWTAGSEIVIKGNHNGYFENRGSVIKFTPPNTLAYNYLSSISHLPDSDNNRTMLLFDLIAIADKTRLKLTLRNFPTESILKHLDFYWSGTLTILK